MLRTAGAVRWDQQCHWQSEQCGEISNAIDSRSSSLRSAIQLTAVAVRWDQQCYGQPEQFAEISNAIDSRSSSLRSAMLLTAGAVRWDQQYNWQPEQFGDSSIIQSIILDHMLIRFSLIFSGQKRYLSWNVLCFWILLYFTKFIPV